MKSIYTEKIEKLKNDIYQHNVEIENLKHLRKLEKLKLSQKVAQRKRKNKIAWNLEQAEIANHALENLSLSVTARKYGVSREWVRLILKRRGIKSLKPLKEAQRQQIKLAKIEAKKRICEKCGTKYKYHTRKLQTNLCHDCHLKDRAKLSGYKHQKKWNDKNKKYRREKNRAYYQAHRVELNKKARKYHKKWLATHREEYNAYQRQYWRKRRAEKLQVSQSI